MTEPTKTSQGKNGLAKAKRKGLGDKTLRESSGLTPGRFAREVSRRCTKVTGGVEHEVGQLHARARSTSLAGG